MSHDEIRNMQGQLFAHGSFLFCLGVVMKVKDPATFETIAKELEGNRDKLQAQFPADDPMIKGFSEAVHRLLHGGDKEPPPFLTVIDGGKS